MAVKIDCSIEGMISCSQFDHTGHRLALCCSDTSIKIYSYADNLLSEICILQHHLGEVLSLSWSHPKFSSLLASCGSDRKVLIWREQSQRFWNIVYEHTDVSSVNCISWAPWELGLQLLAGLEDGNIIIFTYKSEWESQKLLAHDCAVKVLTWGSLVSLVGASGGSLEKWLRFVTGASDGKIKYWVFEDGRYMADILEKHVGCIRDLAWNPDITSNREQFASCADRTVVIWSLNENSMWKAKDTILFPAPVWKISWNPLGNYLAVSAADNITRILSENIEENWKVIKQIKQNGEVLNNSDI